MADENDIPTRFGCYEMLKTIGKGNFAVVKLARHTIINLQVAIKVISIKSLDADQRRKLTREIDIMKHVGSHKNVVRLYQVMHSDRHVMLVTEYCEGGELFEQLVTKGRLSEKNSRFYFNQIVDAVKYLHSNGIVHRDLKAENLLLTSDFKCVKLADFGFSNYYSNQSFLATWCGSPPYAAPELFEGKQYNGPKADIWSLGVVLYVLVCGSLPFDGNTLQSLKTRVLSGKFRIPYFMSRDCEHLIRHMLVIDPDKRFSLQQIKQHRWMCDTDQNSSEKLSDKLKNCHISGETADLTTNAENEIDKIDSSLVEWIASELNVNSSDVLESIKSRSFDEYYALYCLVNDTSHCTSTALSAPPSPPLLPIVPSTNQRKSSITTGIVEREPTPTNLAPNVSNVRRHTCPDANTGTDTVNCPNQLATPTLFLTPPVVTSAAMAPPMSNLPLAPPNFPLAMDLLKPPPVLLLANNNMGRRASDGQANYTRAHSEISTQTVVPTGSYGISLNNKGITGFHQTSPPISYVKRKRHSLTDTNELISRQRRLQLAQVNLNVERSRRRASDGSTAGIFHHQQISIPTLQNELRALCVSSPPSLHTSPIHGSSLTNQNIHQAHISAISNSSSASLPPSSPPPTLPQISEENSYNKNENDAETMDERQENTKIAQKAGKMLGLMIQQRYSGSPVPLITPPQSFRSSPVTSPNHTTPSISITDELGTSQFPILPPPIDFQLVANSHPNLDKDPSNSKMSTDFIFNRLHRWRNDEKIVALSSVEPNEKAESISQNFPSYPNLNFEDCLTKQYSTYNSAFAVGRTNYTSLQCMPCVINNSHFTTTDSGSICINDTKTAAKLLSRFGHDDKINRYEHHIWNFGQSDLQISIEWNELQQKLILKHVSGDASQYKNLCYELISTII